MGRDRRADKALRRTCQNVVTGSQSRYAHAHIYTRIHAGTRSRLPPWRYTRSTRRALAKLDAAAHENSLRARPVDITHVTGHGSRATLSSSDHTITDQTMTIARPPRQLSFLSGDGGGVSAETVAASPREEIAALCGSESRIRRRGYRIRLASAHSS